MPTTALTSGVLKALGCSPEDIHEPELTMRAKHSFMTRSDLPRGLQGPLISPPRYLKRALVWLVATTAMYFLMNGAQIFETVLIVPAWSAAPPASLAMFQGEFRLDFKAFWIVFHSLHELTFIMALVFVWRLKVVREWVLALLIVHVAVRVWTVVYFAPTIIGFQGMPYSATIDPALVEKAALWRNMNVVRVMLFVSVNCALLLSVYRVARMLCASQLERS
jgi:hypothetical protein